MAANSDNVFAGLGQDLVTGTVRSGAYGTPLPPTDDTFFEAPVDDDLLDAGYIGEAGVTISQGRSFTDIKDMDGNVIETIQTESNGQIKTTFLELNDVTLGNLFGEDNVDVTANTTTHGTRYAVAVALSEDLDPKSHVFRVKSGKKRVGLVVPKGRFTEVGDVAFTNSGAAQVDVTIKTIPVYDAARQKNVDFYLIFDNGVWAVSLVPVINTVTPNAQTAGNPLTIRGKRFTGATAVTVGGVSVGAGKFTVVDDETIVAVVPAGSAGSAPVIVTNASGPSAAKPYTRGA